MSGAVGVTRAQPGARGPGVGRSAVDRATARTRPRRRRLRGAISSSENRIWLTTFFCCEEAARCLPFHRNARRARGVGTGRLLRRMPARGSLPDNPAGGSPSCSYPLEALPPSGIQGEPMAVRSGGATASLVPRPSPGFESPASLVGDSGIGQYPALTASRSLPIPDEFFDGAAGKESVCGAGCG
jgi:hypothetical protein